MPLSRIRLAACLWVVSFGLTAALAVEPDAPFDGRQEGVPAAVRSELEQLGYRFDDASGKVVSSGGDPLTSAEYRRLTGEFSLKETPLDDEHTYLLRREGYRLEEDGDRVLSPVTKKFSTRLEIAVIQAKWEGEDRRQTLEYFVHEFSRLKGDQPLHFNLGLKYKGLAKDARGLSPELIAALNDPNTKVSRLLELAQRGYQDSTRFFDGQMPLRQLEESAVAGKEGSGLSASAFDLDETERKLGAAFRLKAKAHLEKNFVGREIFGHLEESGGKGIPPFLVADTPWNLPAAYDRSAIIFNRKLLVQDLTEGLPSDRREYLVTELSTPGKLERYMVDHPEALDAFIDRHDAEIVHEMTHAWQGLRGGINAEQARGNLPPGTFLEEEEEAFVWQLRYAHAKFMADPNAPPRDFSFDHYRALLADFAAYRDWIAQTYSAAQPMDTNSFETALELQDERASVAGLLMREGPLAAIERLKLRGIKQGSQAIRAEQSFISKEMDAFLRNEYPSIRRDGYRALAELDLSKAKKANSREEQRRLFGEAATYAREIGEADLLRRIEKLEYLREPIQ